MLMGNSHHKNYKDNEIKLGITSFWIKEKVGCSNGILKEVGNSGS